MARVKKMPSKNLGWRGVRTRHVRNYTEKQCRLSLPDNKDSSRIRPKRDPRKDTISNLIPPKKPMTIIIAREVSPSKAWTQAPTANSILDDGDDEHGGRWMTQRHVERWHQIHRVGGIFDVSETEGDNTHKAEDKNQLYLSIRIMRS